MLISNTELFSTAGREPWCVLTRWWRKLPASLIVDEFFNPAENSFPIFLCKTTKHIRRTGGCVRWQGLSCSKLASGEGGLKNLSSPDGHERQRRKDRMYTKSIRGVDPGRLRGPDSLKICRRGQSMFWPPKNITFFHSILVY